MKMYTPLPTVAIVAQAANTVLLAVHSQAGHMDDAAERGMGAENRARTTADLLEDDEEADVGVDRLRAAKYVAPFLFLGLFDLVLLLGWGLDPLWGFMILPPILFVSVLAWIAFRTGFASERTGQDRPQN